MIRFIRDTFKQYTKKKKFFFIIYYTSVHSRLIQIEVKFSNEIIDTQNKNN